jgi:hypothetical protein
VLRIVDGTGAAIKAPKVVGPINLLGKCFFRNVRFFLGGHLVSDANNMYMYRAYLETELSANTEAKKTHLQMSGYVEDNSEKMDTVDNDG